MMQIISEKYKAKKSILKNTKDENLYLEIYKRLKM